MLLLTTNIKQQNPFYSPICTKIKKNPNQIKRILIMNEIKKNAYQEKEIH